MICLAPLGVLHCALVRPTVPLAAHRALKNGGWMGLPSQTSLCFKL